jgi:hypothetical protein
MPAHLRVSVSDRPGSLGALTAALGAAGANVVSVSVLEREQGRAVDDLLLDWPYERPFDAVIRAVARCDGARLHGLRHVAETSVTRDCDVVRQVLEQPNRALETLVDALPHVLLGDWCAALDRRWPLEPVYGTSGVPLPLPDTGGPLDRPRAFTHREESLLLVAVPTTPLRMLLGRFDGPSFTRSEVDRATALVGVTTGVIRLAYRPELTRHTTPVTARILDSGAARSCA